MPSLFEHISKNLVRELGDKDLRPMRCLSNANQFRQLAILQKRKKRSPFWEQPDIPAEYTLMDLLEPSSSVPGIVNKGKGARSRKHMCSQAVQHTRIP